MTHQVFISYARKDGTEFAMQLAALLPEAGFTTWFDQRGIDETQDFTAEIENALEAASQVVACVTPDVQRDNSFVRREIGYAQLLDKPIVVARFADVRPPISIVNNTWLDFWRGWDEAFRRLCGVLLRPPSQRVPGQPLSSAPLDPLRPYLNALYRDIVRYLSGTVFSVLPAGGPVKLAPLRACGVPGLVDSPATIRAQALPRAFFEMANLSGESGERFSSLQEAFVRYDGRLLVLGDPGSGKTTALMALARDMVAKRLADQTEPLPIVVPIATWDPIRRPALRDWLPQVVPPLRDAIGDLLTDETAVLMFDGLDELGSSQKDPATEELFDPRARFVELIPPSGRVVISCRALDFDAVGRRLPLSGAVRLQPLDDDDLRAFLVDFPDLWVVLEKDEGLRDMARTPLLLSIFAFAFAGVGKEARKLGGVEKGETRDRIFTAYVERRYAGEARRFAPKLPYDLARLKHLLGELGIQNAAMPARAQNIVDLDSVVRVAGPDAAGFLELVTRLNLLVPIQAGQSYRFAHMQLRNFFTYPAAISRLDAGEWDVRSNAALALGTIGDGRAVEPLLAALSRSNSYERGAMSYALGRLGDSRAVTALLNVLSDPQYSTKRAAALALVQIGAAAVPAVAVALAAATTPPDERNEAAFVLGRLGATAPLSEALRGDRVELRASSAYGLSQAAEAGLDVVDALVAATNDASLSVRYHAVRGLRATGAVRAVPCLVRLLADRGTYVAPDRAAVPPSRWLLPARICDIAAEALLAIGTEDAIAAVEAWQKSPDALRR